MGKTAYKDKILYISLKNKKGEFKRIYYDKISEMNIEYITLTSNVRRRISTNQLEFFVEGSNEAQTFKEYKYYNYSIRKAADKRTKELIEQMRTKYNITKPQLYVGERQELILEWMILNSFSYWLKWIDVLKVGNIFATTLRTQ